MFTFRELAIISCEALSTQTRDVIVFLVIDARGVVLAWAVSTRVRRDLAVCSTEEVRADAAVRAALVHAEPVVLTGTRAARAAI